MKRRKVISKIQMQKVLNKKYLKLITSIFVLAVLCMSSRVEAATYLSDGFESGDLSSPGGNGGSWTGFEGSAADLGSISSDRAHAGTYSAKFHYAGNADLGDDAWMQLVFDFGQNVQDFWLKYYIFFPSGYDIRVSGSSDNTKVFVIWGDSYNTDPLAMGMEMESNEAAGFKGYIAGYPASLSCSGAFGYVPGGLRWTLSEGDKNKWLTFKFHVKRDSGIGDGMFEMWVDGTKTIEFVNQSFSGAPCSPDYWRHGYLMGWSNSGFTNDTDVYIDDVTMGSEDPDAVSDTVEPAAPGGLSVS